jgi:hypothetical protein
MARVQKLSNPECTCNKRSSELLGIPLSKTNTTSLLRNIKITVPRYGLYLIGLHERDYIVCIIIIIIVVVVVVVVAEKLPSLVDLLIEVYKEMK